MSRLLASHVRKREKSSAIGLLNKLRVGLVGLLIAGLGSIISLTLGAVGFILIFVSGPCFVFFWLADVNDWRMFRLIRGFEYKLLLLPPPPFVADETPVIETIGSFMEYAFAAGPKTSCGRLILTTRRLIYLQQRFAFFAQGATKSGRAMSEVWLDQIQSLDESEISCSPVSSGFIASGWPMLPLPSIKIEMVSGESFLCQTANSRFWLQLMQSMRSS